MKIKALRDLSSYGVNLQELVKYAHTGDAAFDLVSTKEVTIPQGKWAIIPSGIAIELPPNHFGLILPRSGVSKYRGIQILGGVIDSGYSGEIFVNLANYSSLGSFAIKVGLRIAQLAVIPYQKVILEWMQNLDELTQTDRGDAGHGSTGD